MRPNNFGPSLLEALAAQSQLPFQPPKYEVTMDGSRVRTDKERKQLVINTEPQPWQKHDAKLKARAIAAHAGWNDRREARELRKSLEMEARR